MSELQHYREYHPAVRMDEDEISLTDIWLMLSRRRWVVLGGVVIALVLAVAFALAQPTVYRYTTAIEIGTRGVGDNVRPIENPETVLAKVQESFVPLTLRQFREAQPNAYDSYSIEARIPKQSRLVVLETTGTSEQEKSTLGVLTDVIERVRSDHGRIVAVIKKDLEVRRNQALNRIASLEQESELLAGEMTRVEETTGFIDRRIDELQRSLDQIREQRNRLRKESSGNAGLASVVLLESELRETMRLISELQLQRNQQLANQKEELFLRIEENKRDLEAQQDKLAKLQMEIANFQETRAVVEPMQSLEAVGPSRSMIVLIAGVLGLMVGVFAAFFLEFLGNVRKAEAQLGEPKVPAEPAQPEPLRNHG